MWPEPSYARERLARTRAESWRFVKGAARAAVPRAFPVLRHIRWPSLALPAADEGRRGIGDLHRWVGVEAAVDGAFLGSDGMRDAAPTRTAALRERFRERPRARARNL
jgi:hypothetical protein